MTADALAFMIGSWTLVLTLTAWCFRRVLLAGRKTDAGAAASSKSPGAEAAKGEPPS